MGLGRSEILSILSKENETFHCTRMTAARVLLTDEK